MGQNGVVVAAEHDVRVIAVDHGLTGQKVDPDHFDFFDLFQSCVEMVGHSSQIGTPICCRHKSDTDHGVNRLVVESPVVVL
jgi:hypothetical protein